MIYIYMIYIYIWYIYIWYIYIWYVCVCLCVCVHTCTYWIMHIMLCIYIYNHVQYTVVCMHTLLLLSSFDEPTAMPTWCASGDRAQFWWPTTSETTYLLHNNLNISSSIMFIHFLGASLPGLEKTWNILKATTTRPILAAKPHSETWKVHSVMSLFLLIKIRFLYIGVFRPENQFSDDVPI